MKQKRLLSWPDLATFKADTSVEQQANDTVRINGLLKPGTTWIAVPAAGEVPDDNYLIQKDNDTALTFWASAVSRLLAPGISLPLSDLLDNTETLEPLFVPGAVPGGAYAMGLISGDMGLRLSVQPCVTPDEIVIRVKNNSGALVPATTMMLNIYAVDASAVAPSAPPSEMEVDMSIQYTLSPTTPNDISIAAFLSTAGLGGTSIVPDMLSYYVYDWGIILGEILGGGRISVDLMGSLIHFYSSEPNFAFYLYNETEWTINEWGVTSKYHEYVNPVTNEHFYLPFDVRSQPPVPDPSYTLLTRTPITGLYENPTSDYYSYGPQNRVDGTYTMVLRARIPPDKFNPATMVAV